MHWILTVIVLIAGRPVIDHQEYYSLNNCQEAAMVLQKQNKDLMGGYEVYTRFACTPKDDNPVPN